MALSIGIVGLPNVGKSTVFNALTDSQDAEVANYPFCTIQPNRAIVALPDSRLERLAHLVPHDTVTAATVEFVDIAGLVAGASAGEGLGNQFLGHIRDTAAIVHVVRCFDDPNIVHISPIPNPQSDIEIVNLELIMADLQQVEARLDRLPRQVKGDKTLQPVLDAALEIQALLESGKPVSMYAGRDADAFRTLDRDLRFLTGKPVIYVANVDETGLTTDLEYVRTVRAIAAEQSAPCVVLCARFEEEMVGMEAEERAEFFELVGVHETGLTQVIRIGYELLGLSSYFTTDSRTLRAWTIRSGWTAPQAAGVIHGDFERGFIRAEVIHWSDYELYGSESACKAAGVLHIEGRDYVVQDGDVVHFRFNV